MTTAGIDFGTTNSVLSIWTPSGVEVIDIDTPPLEWEQMGFAKVMPTIIAADSSGNTEYGWKAKQGTNQVLEAVKRLLPTEETVMVGDQPVLVEQLVATFFAHIKRCALEKGVEIDRVVVTIPANSRGIARFRTKVCAQMAGLEVLTLINEPTAAAMAASSRFAQDGKILVIDWGGGTLDVTALESTGGVFIEESSSGIPKSGGKDFDQRLANYLLEGMPDVKWDSGSRRTFALEVEMAKIKLSSQDSVVVSLPGGGTRLVTRAKFEELVKPLVEDLRRPIEQCMRDAKWLNANIDHVLLVGGTCNIPAVRKIVHQLLGKEPSIGLNAMTAISEGAAIAAAILTGEQADFDFFVATEHSLGTVIFDKGYEEFSEIISKNHKLPATGKKSYSPVFAEQETVNIKVVEGDPNLPLDHEINSQIISWEIKLPDPSRDDGRFFTLEYKYDVEGILHVKAEDDLTGDILLEETVSFGASGDRKKMVKIAKEVSSTMATGSIDNSLSRSSLDPEVLKLLDQARSKVAPFLEDDDSAAIRALADALENAKTSDERSEATKKLRAVLSQYSYLL
jgi:molecular chaperone DnaK (HSP70)